MKKLNLYEINSGEDGFVLAKSINQVAKILSKNCGSFSFIYSSLKKGEKEWLYDGEWIVTEKFKVPKKKECKQSKFIGGSGTYIKNKYIK